MLQIACDWIGRVPDGTTFEEYLDQVEQLEWSMGLQREPDPAPVIGFPESDID